MIRRGNKTKKQGNILANINRLCNGRNDDIKFFEDYGSKILEAKNKAAEEPTTGTELKILTPKQLLQRFPIILGQVKAGSNSENLLTISDKSFILCISQKKSLKKYTII